MKNRRHKPEPQKALVVTAIVAHGLEFYMNRVVHLLGKQVGANRRNHRADFLNRKSIREVILAARIHRNHGRFKPQRATFHVVREHDKRLQVTANHRMFTFASVITFHRNFKHGVCAQGHFNFIGQLRAVLL